MKLTILLVLLLSPLSSVLFAANILTIGDSLTAGYQVDAKFSYPSLIQKKINDDGFGFKVINLGISGDTTANALARINQHLVQYKPVLVIIALGANDGLRGRSLKSIEKNLRSLIQRCLARKAKVLLTEMKVPPNYGPKYQNGFAQIFTRLGKIPGVQLMPFLLEGVAGESTLNLGDGIHPNRKGYELIAKNVYKWLQPVLISLKPIPSEKKK